MLRYTRLLGVSILFALLFGTFIIGTSAQDAPSPYTGLNLLLLNDQSSSMGGPPFGGTADYGPAGTDPNGLRFSGSQYATKHLSYLLQATSLAARPEINIALISFGTFPRDILSWQSLDISALDWENTLTNLVNDLSESRWTGRNLGETNFLGVYQKAAELFNSSPSTPGTTYRNVIVLLTDGAPCVSSDPLFQETLTDGRIVYNCLLPGRREAMKQHLSRLYDFVSSQFTPPKFELYVIAIDVGIPQPYWAEFEADWARITCEGQSSCDPSLRYRKVDNANQIGVQINRILNDALQGILPPFDTQAVNTQSGQIIVKPIQQALRVDIFKVNNESSGARFTANGQPVDLPNSDGDLSGIEIYEFSQPVPGMWTLDLMTQVAGVQYSTIPPIVTADNLPDKGEVFSAIPVTVTLSDSNGTALKVDPNYPSNLVTAVASVYDATLIDRDQRPKLLEIPLTVADDNVYRYTGTWTPLKNGIYEIRVSASYKNLSGVDEILVNTQTVKDRLEVVGSFVEWQGIQPLSERADKTFTVSGIVKNALTSAPIQNTSSLKVRVTLFKPDGSVYKEEIVDNQAQSAGEVKASFQVEAGVYNAQLEVLYDDGVNPSQVMGNRSIPQQIEARPVHPLVLQILQPSAGNIEAQAFSFSPFELNFNVPVPVQVVLLDTLTNQYVSLAAATNGALSLPTFTINGTPVQLNELQAGVYTAQLTDLGMGGYRMDASLSIPDIQLIEDYSWISSSAQTQVTRTFSGSLALATLVLIAFLITLGASGFALWRRSVWLAQYPLQGKVIFGYDDLGDGVNITYIPHASFDLGKRTAHTQTFKNVRLPGSFKTINKVTFSTRREKPTSENGEAYVTELIVDGAKVKYLRKLISGESWAPVLTSADGQRLMICKDEVTNFYEEHLRIGSI